MWENIESVVMAIEVCRSFGRRVAWLLYVLVSQSTMVRFNSKQVFMFISIATGFKVLQSVEGCFYLEQVMVDYLKACKVY